MDALAWPFRADQIEPRLFQIWDPAGVSCFLIEGEKSALLMDTGFGIGDLRGFLGALTEKPLIVINSHGHIDHLGGNYQFESAYLHPADWALARGHCGREERANALRFLKVEDDSYLDRGCGHLVPLASGHRFDLGNRIVEVIACPGHTAGSVALLDHRTGVLLGGDTFSRHIWLFDDDSTPLVDLLATTQRVQRIALAGIVGSHVAERLAPRFLADLADFLGRVRVEASRPFEVPLARRTVLLYHEGGELFRSPDFLSILFTPEKLA